MGEDPRVVNAIAAQDGNVAPQTIEDVVVQIANELSTSRPGARRDFLESYIKRLESLERIAREFEGVQDAFAIQAGRELRVIVNNASVDDARARDLAKDIARRIEQELRYPGRIKVTIVREKRLIEYAR
jgi:ribonuclease Y